MDNRYEAIELTVERTRGLLVTFADGHIIDLDLEQLRLACPCASCRSLTDRGDMPSTRRTDGSVSTIRDARLHGGWGLNLIWDDGHSTGIYYFELLRNLYRASEQ